MSKQNRKLFLLVLLVVLTSALFLLFQNDFVKAQDSVDDDEIKEDISNVQKKLNKEEQERQQLLQELNQIQTSVNKTQYEISKTQSLISETKDIVDRMEKEIELLNKKIELQRILLASLVREMYYSETSPVEMLIIGSGGISQFLGNSDHIASIEQKIADAIMDIKLSKEKIESEKNKLEGIKEDHERLLSLKQDQQHSLLSEKYETQSDIQDKEATIVELQAKLYKLRTELSRLLGKSFNAKDIEDAASFAAKATGVRKDFIMGMLVVESDLGRFTGGCNYKESRMSDYRKEIFKDICEELDYDYKKMKVSCPPRSYSGTGGAMGVAQFMPDTWLGYKSSVASLTGHNPPDPWNLTDGVTAMALKLAKGGAKSKSGECNAAKLYLSGTTSSSYNWYCDRVKYWADNYERLLD